MSQGQRTNSEAGDVKACVMKGEKELVMDEGIDGRGQKRGGKEAQPTEIFVLCNSDFFVWTDSKMTD